MKKVVMCLCILLIISLLVSCSDTGSPAAPQTEAPPTEQPTEPQIEAPASEQLAPEQPVDWSQINLPAVGNEGNYVLTPGMGVMSNAVFSTDGKTIYGLGSNGHYFLRKSNDGGHSWITLPAFEALSLTEAFFMKMVNDELFIGSGDERGIFRSVDGGRTFDNLPPIKDSARGGVWGFDATVDATGKPVLLAGIFGGKGNGLWILRYPYEEWVDTRVGNVDSGSGEHVVWQMAFSPNYAEDGQLIALIGDGEHLWVSFKYGDEAWGARIADAYIPDDETYNDLRMMFSRFAFPDDYNSQNPVVFIGAGLYTEFLTKTPQYADLYRIDGSPAGSGASIATDLDVGGKGTTTPAMSVLVKGPADAATILAGSAFQVYRSTDGGQSWQTAKKPPTGGVVYWMAFDPLDDTGSLVYALPTAAGHAMVPRGADVPVRESAFSYSTDGGVTWNQVSQIDTRIDDIIGHAVSPNYDNDETMFMLTSSRHMLTLSLTEYDTINVTREPDEPGVVAKVYVTPHPANPPIETMLIDNGDPYVTRKDWSTGTGPNLVLNDEYPTATIKVLPLTETSISGLVNMFEGWLPGYTDPWYAEEWLALTRQPRQVVIFTSEGSVTVTRSELPEARISVDGDASDWQDIEPVITDPGKDAPSKDEDLKALYVTNDSEYLYLMVEFYGQEPRSSFDIHVDLDSDGVADHTIHTYSPDNPQGPLTFLSKPARDPNPVVVSQSVAAFGQVAELKFPIKDVNVEKFRIIEMAVQRWSADQGYTYLEGWQGFSEVEIEQVAAPTPIVSPPVPFPSTESMWKTTDGGATWERILTSGLNLSVGGEQAKVGHLDSVALSINFAQDNTIYVYEEGDSSRVWASTDGGMTFVLCK